MTKEEKRLSRKDWRVANRDKIKSDMAKWRAKNAAHIKEYELAYRKKNAQRISESMRRYRNGPKREEILERKRRCAKRRYAAGFRWRPATPEDRRRYMDRDNAYRKRRYKEDVCFRILVSCRNRMSAVLGKNRKAHKTAELLGCSIEEFKLHIESQFSAGMSWSNYGSLWELDHIKPCALFDLKNQDDQRRCFHFSNIRPLSCVINRSRTATVRRLK